MASDVPRGPRQMWKATLWSLKGLRTAWRVEASFRLEIYLFCVLGPLALWLGRTGSEKALLFAVLVLVLVAELLNSAIEAAVDRLGPQHDEFAARAKDMGSAAVFLCMLNVPVCWALVLAPF